MVKPELEEYLINLGFVKEGVSSFTKEYNVFDETTIDVKDTLTNEANRLVIEYKFKNKLVFVIYHNKNKKIKRYKGKLSSMKVNEQGNLIGLQSL